MSARDRRTIRYGVPAVAVLAGVLCAAALTNSVGNTVATVLIGGGLLVFVIFMLRDMGLLEGDDPAAPSTPPPAAPPPAGPADNGGEPDHGSGADPGSGNGSAPGSGARRSVNVPRPDRMRGQRRRLR